MLRRGAALLIGVFAVFLAVRGIYAQAVPSEAQGVGTRMRVRATRPELTEEEYRRERLTIQQVGDLVGDPKRVAQSGLLVSLKAEEIQELVRLAEKSSTDEKRYRAEDVALLFVREGLARELAKDDDE